MSNETKLHRGFPPGCQANEPKTQLDLNREWYETWKGADTRKPDYSVSKPSQPRNCLTHSVAPWSHFSGSREPESSSSGI